MLEYIYICRHGFRSNMVAMDAATSPTGMRLDHPLSVHGVQQAAHLASFLSTPARLAPYPVPDRVFSSPFYRCIQTASPTAALLAEAAAAPRPIALDHGVAEWYAPARAGTGLHPRPGHAADLQRFFPGGALDRAYASTVYPDRRGETMHALFDRVDSFVDVFTARMDKDPAAPRAVAIFAHAATVIALGRALTGERDAEVCAGCACTSLYRRKRGVQEGEAGVGQWEMVWNGRADYMPGGLERDWSFNQVALAGGEVIEDEGDHLAHPPEDELPVGLARGMERFVPPRHPVAVAAREGRPAPSRL